MKIKRPLALALAAAQGIVTLLAPACERIEIAGSIRRQAATVGDIELVAIPRPTLNLLGEPDGSEIDGLLRGLVPLEKDGPRYKQWLWLDPEIDSNEPYQVDLFLADAANWGYILMLRTGPADFSHRMVTPRPHGLKPPGVTVHDGYVWSYPGNVRLEVPDEQTLFAMWFMNFIPPQARK